MRHLSKRRAVAVIAAGLALAPILTGCSNKSSAPGDGKVWSSSQEVWGTFNLSENIQKKVESDEELEIVLVNPYQEGDWWRAFTMGMEAAGEAVDVSVQFVAQPQYDVSQQVSNLQTVLQSNPDGIGVFTGDANALTPVIDRIIDEGIPVVTYNVDSPESKRLAYIGPDNYEYGAEVGKAFAERFTSGEVLVMSAVADSDYTKQRLAGFESELPDGVSIAGSPINIGTDVSAAVGKVDAALKANPDVRGIYVTDDAGVAVGEWIAQNDAQGEYTVAMHNLLPATLSHIADGNIQISVGQYPFRQGSAVVTWLANYVRSGEKICEICSTGYLPVTDPDMAKSLLDSDCSNQGCA